MHAMTGSWLAVKWVGVAITAIYLVLSLVVLVRFRRNLSRLRNGLTWPAVLGVFISVSIPSVFENIAVTRVCFIASSLLYLVGIAILLRGLAQKDHQGLMKAEG
jgi:hypothetical protein